MYYLITKLEISHFVHGKMIIVAYLKSNNLNERHTITASEMLKPRLMDYFTKLEESKELISVFKVCEGIVNLLHPYCCKCSIKIDDNDYSYEK